MTNLSNLFSLLNLTALGKGILWIQSSGAQVLNFSEKTKNTLWKMTSVLKQKV